MARRPRRAAGGGGALKGWGSGERAWEVRWGEVKPFPRSVGAEAGRRRGLRVEAVGGGNHGGKRLFWATSRASARVFLGARGGEGRGEASPRSERAWDEVGRGRGVVAGQRH